MFQEIPLNQISPNPDNPRKVFSGDRFDELVKSIRKVGVLEPIIVRTLIEKNTTGFQLVAGERRFRASMAIARENDEEATATIPAMVREMTDDEAFDVMTIENLQREDLAPLEEAQNFKMFLNRHGAESLPDLSDRTGISARYIQRRVMVLELPAEALEAWNNGSVKYGHLEQLCRVRDKETIAYYLERISDHRLTVGHIKREIDSRAPKLSMAMFSKKDAGCSKCGQNTTAQASLFPEDSMEKGRCTNPACYKRLTAEYLAENWDAFKKKYKIAANGFRWDREINWNDCESFWHSAPFRACRKCENLVIFLTPGEKPENNRRCLDPACYRKMRDAQAAGKKEPKPKDPDAPRVSWHGAHFREQFYQEQIPVRFSAMKATSFQAGRLQLLALLMSNHDLFRQWFMPCFELKEGRETGDYAHYYTVPTSDLVNTVMAIPDRDLPQVLHEAALEVTKQPEYGTETRHQVAGHLGIDLQKEWRFNAEYLDKKTKAEILQFGEDLGIFADPKAQAFLYETLGKKRGAFKTLKKPELIRVFLESGADLAGKVPAEILNVPERG